MAAYDNRDTSVPSGQGRHFTLRLGKKRLVYCYIRKNACSAFKLLFEQYSPHKGKRSNYNTPYEFMAKNHAMKKGGKLEKYDHSIFVYRDVIERSVSLFCNKFIQCDGNEGIFDNYLSITGQNPERASFSEFVELYLSNDFAQLDPHTHPQSHHLRPERYTDAIPLHALHAEMSRIVGPAIADNVFARPRNSSTHLSVLPLENAGALPADTLRDLLLAHGQMPTVGAFLTDGLRQRIEHVYRDDLTMLATIAEGRSAGGVVP